MRKKSIVLVPLSPQEVCAEQKILKREFEKRPLREAKEPHESVRSEKRTASSKESIKEAEHPLRVPEIKQEREKKEEKAEGNLT